MPKICIITDCVNYNHGRGLCDKHYKLWQRQQRPEYSIWLEVKRRCYNPNFKDFKNYGGRGIKMCDEWKSSFSNFYNSLGQRPTPKHQIDRIDNEGNYEPDNCRWATRREQANNKRNNRLVTIHGKTKTFSGWSDETGLSRELIRDRYYKGHRGNRLLIPKIIRGEK